jgi:hypothetical protein
MKQLFLSAVLLLMIAQSFGQSCGSAPLDSISFENQLWVGNNAMLNQLYDSISSLIDTAHYQHKTQSTIVGGFDAQTIFWVPIKA